MKPSRKILAVLILIAAASCLSAVAGTLDTAPFQVVAPGSGWILDDSYPQQIGGGVVLAASLLNEKEHIKSIVGTGIVKPTSTVLDELCSAIRTSCLNPMVKKLADEPVVFAGHKAQAITYVVAPGTPSGTYNEARVFVVGNVAWVISVTGPIAQKDAIKKVLTYYRPRKG